MKIRSLRKGLTLIEMVLSVMILSVIFTGLFSAYYTSIVITGRAASTVGATSEELLQAVDVIVGDFSRLYYISGNKKIVFIGKPEGDSGGRNDRVDFAAVHPSAMISLTPAVREVSYYLKSGENDYYTLIKREDSSMDNKTGEGGVEYSLLGNVKSFMLVYSENGKDWVDEWDSVLRKKIPRIIRIEIIANIEGREKRYETIAFPGIYSR